MLPELCRAELLRAGLTPFVRCSGAFVQLSGPLQPGSHQQLLRAFVLCAVRAELSGAMFTELSGPLSAQLSIAVWAELQCALLSELRGTVFSILRDTLYALLMLRRMLQHLPDIFCSRLKSPLWIPAVLVRRLSVLRHRALA